MKTFLKKLAPTILILSFLLQLSGNTLIPIAEAQNETVRCTYKKVKLSDNTSVNLELNIPKEACNTNGSPFKNPPAGYKYIDFYYDTDTTEKRDDYDATIDAASTNWWDVINCARPENWVNCALRNFVATISGLALSIIGLFTGLASVILNSVIYYTIVSVKDNYNEIGSINSTWKVVRDVANMAFIFILLYAAIKTIIGSGSDTQKLVVKVVVVAILINFSMFATMVVIDASNLFALTFYESIAPGALNAAGTFDLTQAGLSNAFTQHLNLTSLYSSAGKMTFGNIIIVGVLGSIVLLITAFCFFAIAIMLLIRYVLLIMVIILSPIAFLAYVFPEMKEYASKWQNTLIGQAFFAPIYFMLTWVALSVLEGMMGNSTFGTSGDLASVGWLGKDATGIAAKKVTDLVTTLVNFGVVIIFLLTSLIVAKKWANKAPDAGGLTSWATNKAGAATFGVMGAIGRNSFGAAADKFKGSATYQRMQANTGTSRMARLGVAAANKAGSGSYDLRGAPGGGGIGAGGPSGAGGYEGRKKAKEAEIKARKANAAKAQQRVDIHDAMKPGGAGAAAPGIGDKIRRLSDEEIENLNPNYITDPAFATEMKSTQADLVNKSDSFTDEQKKKFKDNRSAPLFAAITAADIVAARTVMNKLSIKELATIKDNSTTPPRPTIDTLTNPTVMNAYTPSMLRGLAAELSRGDVTLIRSRILAALPTGHSTEKWLNSPDGQSHFS